MGREAARNPKPHSSRRSATRVGDGEPGGEGQHGGAPGGKRICQRMPRRQLRRRKWPPRPAMSDIFQAIRTPVVRARALAVAIVATGIVDGRRLGRVRLLRHGSAAGQGLRRFHR